MPNSEKVLISKLHLNKYDYGVTIFNVIMVIPLVGFCTLLMSNWNNSYKAKYLCCHVCKTQRVHTLIIQFQLLYCMSNCIHH